MKVSPGYLLSEDSVANFPTPTTPLWCATRLRYALKDKHGLLRTAYSAKVYIYRDMAGTILLGIEDEKLVGGGVVV